MQGGTVVRDQPARQFFENADLETFGVRIPDTVLLHRYLRERGSNSPTVPLTVAEAVEGVSPGPPGSPVPGPSNPPQALSAGPPPEAGDDSAPLIAVAHLSFSYPNGARALDDVSLRCGRGEFLPIIREDGAGILTQMPDRFLRESVGLALPPRGSYAVGLAFLPTDADERSGIEARIVEVAAEEGIPWVPPIDPPVVAITMIEPGPELPPWPQLQVLIYRLLPL